MLGWRGDAQVVGGIRCRHFAPTFQADGGATAAVFEPLSPARVEVLAFIQHGGSSCKDGPDVWDVAHALVGAKGIRLVSLDGPVHGARRPAGDTSPPLEVRQGFFDIWEHSPAHVDLHVQAWRALIDETTRAWQPTRLAWIGLSMGTAYGLPLLASEPRLGSAVIGMWGTSFVNSQRLVADAAKVRGRVLFQQKWHDELFSREGQLALFDALGTEDRRLHVYPGGHARPGPEQMGDLVRFISGEPDE